MGKNLKTLEFDSEKRKEFLTGFSKRKDARRKKARLELDEQLKQERIRIRKNKREEINNRLEEIANIKMAHNIERACIDLDTNVIELPHHNVTVVESELFDPVTDAYMGSNFEETEEEKANEEPTKDKKPKVFDLARSAAVVSKLAKKKQRLNITKKGKKQAVKQRKGQLKATKKLFRKQKSKKKAADPKKR